MNPECGTESGYKTHRNHGQPACPACRAAHAVYVRDWRLRHPEKTANTRAVQHARQRAMTRLARLYPSLFRPLLREELAKTPNTRAEGSRR